MYVPAPKEKKKTTASDLLTNELKAMSMEEIAEHGDKFKMLLEQRDLEDCLYS